MAFKERHRRGGKSDDDNGQNWCRSTPEQGTMRYGVGQCGKCLQFGAMAQVEKERVLSYLLSIFRRCLDILWRTARITDWSIAEEHDDLFAEGHPGHWL